VPAQVAAMMEIERYSHVMHISSTVEGALLPELGVWDVLRAALPAGTISGAPKVSVLGTTLQARLQMLCVQLRCGQSVQPDCAGLARMMRHLQPRRMRCPFCFQHLTMARASALPHVQVRSACPVGNPRFAISLILH
jgi:chorismate binding enzyme